LKNKTLLLLSVLIFLIVFDLSLGLEFSDDAFQFVFWKYRVPKILTACIAGAGLALSGLLMQTLFRNPLAGPFVLGISSGASFGVALLILGSTILPTSISFYLKQDVGISISAMAGSLLVLGLMLWAASRIGGNFTILIVGLIVGQILGAFQGALSFLSNPESLKEFVLWGLGSFNQSSIAQISIMFVLVTLVFVFSFLISGNLNTYLLGDLYAKSMGVDLVKFRRIVILLAGICAGIITAFCGPIAFIGMAVPHLARHLFKTYDHKILLPISVFLGAILSVLCDLISHTFLSGFVIPINIVSAIIGGPVVIWVIFKQRTKMYDV